MNEDREGRRDFRQEVTDKLVEMLEKGAAPWQKPWDPAKAALAMPLNPTTDQPYRGGNALHLLAEGVSKGYEDPRWMTYRQAQENGWQVRAGAKGTHIEFWQFPSREKTREGRDGAEPGATGKDAPLHRIYSVFNAAQIEGIPQWDPPQRQTWEIERAGESILAGLAVPILHDQQDRAYYNRSADEVHLPAKVAFPSAAAYYGTALHEAVHATGHESRLNRDTLMKSDGFGGPQYAREELRAELGSLFLAAQRGIPHNPEQHAAYVGSWIEVLKNDKNEIFRAARDASHATDYLVDREKLREQSLQPDREIETGGREPTGLSKEADPIAPNAQDLESPNGQKESRGDHQSGDQADVVRLETSEHAATFHVETGAVEIVEKNTATEVRELFQPNGAPDTRESAKASEEQILDGVVDGKAAPTGMPGAADQKAAALAAARSIAERELGNEARVYNAHTDSGSYKGPIIGTTEDYLVQRITPQAAVLHEATGPLAGLTANPSQNLAIQYNNHLVSVQAFQPPQRGLERSAERELAR